MTAFEITIDNYELANAAIRDILFMYKDMIESYDGFGSSIDTGTFDPFTFLNSRFSDRPGSSLGIDQRLLHEGSAVALLCSLYDDWLQSDGQRLSNAPFTQRIRGLLQTEHVDHLPLAKAALTAGFQAEEALEQRLPAVYEMYVVGYFRRLLHKRIER